MTVTKLPVGLLNICDELLLHILAFLEIPDLLACSRVRAFVSIAGSGLDNRNMIVLLNKEILMMFIFIDMSPPSVPCSGPRPPRPAFSIGLLPSLTIITQPSFPLIPPSTNLSHLPLHHERRSPQGPLVHDMHSTEPPTLAPTQRKLPRHQQHHPRRMHQTG